MPMIFKIEICNLRNENMLMICKIEICNLRNENMLMIYKIEICNLRNGNMLMICKIEICKSVICETRIPTENSTSQNIGIGQFTIGVDCSLPNNNKNK